VIINLPPINACARAAGFRARAENPDAAGGTSGLTDLLLKSKNYSRKLSGQFEQYNRRASAAEIRVPSCSSGGLLATISDAEPDRRRQRTEQISRALRLLF